VFEDQAQAESFCFADEAVNHSHSAIIQPIKTMAGCVTSVIHNINSLERQTKSIY